MQIQCSTNLVDHHLTPTLCCHTKLMRTTMLQTCIVELNGECVVDQPIGHISNHDGSNVVSFFRTSNCDDASKRNMDGGTWPWSMCSHTLKTKLKLFAKSSKTKQFRKRSYSVLEKLLNERHCECAKMEINASCFKITYVATPLWPSVGVKPNTSKVGDLESSGTPECSKLDSKVQNTSHWGVLGVIGKVLKRRYWKWPRIGHFESVAQVMGKRRAGSQTGSLTPDH